MSHATVDVMKHVEHLCEAIGPRPLGSRGNRAAADYISTVFETSGLNVQIQELPCPAWEENGTQLDLDGETLAVAANTFSPPCDVVASAVPVGTLAELEAADLAGRIGLMYGELAKDTGYGARSAVYFPERDQTIICLLEEKRPAALITVNAKPGSLERLMRDWEFPIPSATVPAEVGLRLLQHSDRKLHLRIDSRQTSGQFSNVIARLDGSRDARVLLMAHLDTMADTPGAIDNASGVAVLLALAERLAKSELAVGLEWLALNGEEVGGLGDAIYLRDGAASLGEVLVAVNVDGVGQRLGVNSVTMMGCSDAFQEHVRDLHARYPSLVWGEPWYESDHSAFLMRGVPCIPMSSVGVGSVLHGPSDTVEWVSPARLDEAVSFIQEVAASLDDKSPSWCRE